MTKISKASIRNGQSFYLTGKDSKLRQYSIVAFCIVTIFILKHKFSSTAFDEDVGVNSGLQGGGRLEIPEAKKPQTKTPEFDQQNLKTVQTVREQHKNQNDRNFGEIASKVFKENQETLELRDHEVFPSEYHFDQKEIYHHYKNGLSGKVIEDMLMCHAYAFHNNVVYGGSCGDPQDNMGVHSALLDSLGLKDILPFACPRDKTFKDDIRRSVIPLKKCKEYDTRIWTPEYVHYLRSIVSLPARNDDSFTVAVHVNRREKITPCSKQHQGFNRYLPNLHFMNVIEKYSKPGGTVRMFSQEESFEPMDDFIAKGYKVSYETDLSKIWHAFATADVFILSRSDFSMIPALIARGKVVYTPSWHGPLKGWEVVDNDIMHKTDAEFVRLRATCRDS